MPLAWWRKPDCNMEAGLRCAIKLLDRLSSLPECVFQHRGGDPSINRLKMLSWLVDSPPRAGPDRRQLGPRPYGNFCTLVSGLD